MAETPLPDDPFAAARARALEAGGFFKELPHHTFCYIPGSKERLVVSFDNLAASRDTVRSPWGDKFLSPRGWSILGIMSRRFDWFRHEAVWQTFDSLRDTGFFRSFGAVSMYGSSMGGYGALAFAPAAPGCTVLAYAPQSSLLRDLAPFETRYRVGGRLGDWSGAYADAAEGIRSAGRAYIAFDPRESIDRAHVARLAGDNTILLPMPSIGHKIPPLLQKMRILKPIAEGALTGTLTEAEFVRIFRARRKSPRWRLNLIERAIAHGHRKLALSALESSLAEAPNWRIRHLRNELRAQMAADQ